MNGKTLPKYLHNSDENLILRKRKPSKIFLKLLVGLVCIALSCFPGYLFWVSTSSKRIVPIPFDAQRITSRCDEIRSTPGIPKDFYSRKQSDRFVNGTQPVLIRNASLWTGRSSEGQTVANGAILLDKGLIKWIGEDLHVNEAVKYTGSDIVVIDAGGFWVTPG